MTKVATLDPRPRELDKIEDIIADLKAGKMVVLMDDVDRENEGDIIMAAAKVRPEDINFMARYGRGLICLTLTAERCRQLRLPPMVTKQDDLHKTAFTVSIEAAQGVTTGISAFDRAHTIRTAVKADATPSDIVMPGHVFPLQAQPGGVLTRAGHTEAGCDLARLAGLEPASVIVEILNEDGTMARRPDLERFAREHGLKLGTIADLIRYRLQNEHEQFGWPLRSALKRIADEGKGVVVLLRMPESPRELMQQIVNLNKPAVDEQHASDSRQVLRTYGLGAQILSDLGVRKMRVLSAPKRMQAISGFGLEVVDYVACD